MSRESMLDEPPRIVTVLQAAYCYGMLVLLLGLLATNLRWYFTLSPGYDGDRYSSFVVVLVLLFNHLAFAFKWRRSVAVAFWTLAVGWLAFGSYYISYWSHVLYPIHTPAVN